MTGPRVLKFGGAALRDAAGLRRAVAIIAATPAPRIVVTSAMEGVTDRLLAAQTEACRDERFVFRAIEELRERPFSTLRELAPQDADVHAQAEATLQRLERLLYGIA